SLAERSERFTHELLVRERAIDLGGVEERDASFHGHPKKRDHLLPISGRPVGHAHSHAAKAQRRNLRTFRSKFAFLHDFSLEAGPRLESARLLREPLLERLK